MISRFWHYKESKPALIVAGVILLITGIYVGSIWSPSADTSRNATEKKEAVEKETIWTCSMHPQIRQAEPGQCPICGMDLIPAKSDSDEDSGRRMMSMTESSMKLAEVRTTLVERRFMDIEIPLTGKVAYDERRVKTISAWMPGRLERLYVDYTGIPVKKGDHLVEIYSPDLFAAQEELLQSRRAAERLQQSSSDIVRRSTARSITASREKLRLLGLSREQVENIEKQNEPSATVQINSPLSGIVIHKNAKEGMYVKTGDTIYTVADLSKVWLLLKAYESDIAWLRYGQNVTIKTEAYGDQTFTGWISFIDPVLNPATRTIDIRVVVDNSTGKLRPNMFITAVVKARVAADDTVISGKLDGKWICPMHPEVIKDKAADCDICGMDLIPSEELGYGRQEEAKPPLIVPASAVLTTGERALVYVRVPNRERPTFEGVEIGIGPRAGDYFIVRSGLSEGMEVVTHGNFKIDSALQLQAKPSMMNPVEEASPINAHANHGEDMSRDASASGNSAESSGKELSISTDFVKALEPLYQAYLKAQQALADDNEDAARAALTALAKANSKVNMSLVKGAAHERWMDISTTLKKSLGIIDEAEDITAIRRRFIAISKAVIKLEETFGHTSDKPHRIAFCPMADDNRGARWLQSGEAVSNPYYGQAMLRCGEIQNTLAPLKGESRKDAPPAKEDGYE